MDLNEIKGKIENRHPWELSRILTGCLNLDFGVNRLLSHMGVRIPGLSLLVVCKKSNQAEGKA